MKRQSSSYLALRSAAPYKPIASSDKIKMRTIAESVMKTQWILGCC